ncbi:MAG: TonB-dependent receptor [Bacteroidetes bacterium]|nr:TonB-dependent receptor [Bacteroidota bacterium]
MKKYILIIILLLPVMYSQAQQNITGKIFDTKTNETIPYATITLDNKGTASDESGIFTLKNIPEGKYTIKISCVGYQNLTQEIVVNKQSDNYFEFFLASKTYLSEEVIVTATKTENYIQDIPVRVNLVSSRQIESLPAQTTDELLNFVPGVNVSRSFGIFSHHANVTMRGLNGQEQGRVLVMIDGVPTNKSDGGSVNWNMLNSDQIERIEVVKGPGSSLYGGNAMGGAINIITKKPNESLQGKVSADYGTYNTMRGQLFLSGKVNPDSDKGLYWNLSSYYRQSDGYISASEADQLANPYIVESDLQEWEASAKLGYDINKNNNIELSVLYYDDDRATGEKVYQPEGNNREHDTYHIRANYSGSKNKLNWKVNIFYLNEDYKRISEWIKDDYTFYKVLSNRVDLGALSTLSYNLEKQIITGGIDLKQGSVDARDEYYTSTDIVYNRGKMNTLGLFIQDEVRLFNDQLKIVAGLRYDYANFFDGGFEIEDPTSETTFMINYHDEDLNEDSWSALSPKVSVQYEFTNDYRIYANYARGFRPAVLDDMCRSGRIRGGFKVSDPGLQPEYLNNFEVGADARFFDRLRTSVSAYYSLGNDFMYYVNTGDSIEFSYGPRPIIKASNISQVEIYGTEIEINYWLNENIIINANYAYAHSQVTNYEPLSTEDPVDLTNKYLSDVPNHMAAASLQWNNKLVNAGLNAKYMGKRWVNDTNQFDEIVQDDQYDAYTTIDLKLSKTIHKVFVNLTIQNILDAKFYDSKGAVNPGRFIMLELGTRF